MKISLEDIKRLRGESGAGIMDCRNALRVFEGDTAKALVHLKEKGFRKAAKKADRETSEGLIESYIHTGSRVGALIELSCETDFVARTDEFKQLAHEIAMQIAAMCPSYIGKEDIPANSNEDPLTACLLEQAYIREPGKKINDLITETIAKVGENIRLKRFTRYELGN